MIEDKTTEIVNKGLKKIQVINTIFIFIAIGLNIYAIFCFNTILLTNKLSYITTIAALGFGLVYTFKGYRKEDVKSFDLFINLCIITLILQAIGEIYSCVQAYQGIKPTIISVFTIVLEIIILVIIETVKDMGKKASLALAYIILGFAIFGFIGVVFTYINTSVFSIYAVLSFSAIVLACITFIFIVAKYRNKNTRGTE